jgi:8-oxo-dGTP diphosphatase
MWFVTQFFGEPHGKEGQEIAWVSKNALSQFEFLEGNREIIDRLQRKDNE